MTDLLAISPSTQICAVIGNPVAHSMSPAIHNAAFAALGLDFVYVAFKVEDLPGALAGMKALENFRGLSITIPHKIEAMSLVDSVAAEDQKIGAINTVVNDSGNLHGCGTDGPGACKAVIDAGSAIDGRQILFLGAGGAARAIAFSCMLNYSPDEIILLDINASMASTLAVDMSQSSRCKVSGDLMNTENLAYAMSRADIIIQCTPLGMHPNENSTPVPKELFREGQVAFDIVYNPLETRFLREAASKGVQTISGVDMFVNQAALQFRLFTGQEPPVDVMRQVVLERLQQ